MLYAEEELEDSQVLDTLVFETKTIANVTSQVSTNNNQNKKNFISLSVHSLSLSRPPIAFLLLLPSSFSVLIISYRIVLQVLRAAYSGSFEQMDALCLTFMDNCNSVSTRYSSSLN